MLKADVLTHYKTATKAAQALEISKAAVSRWGDVVPLVRAYDFERITRKKLKVDRSLYDSNGTPLAEFDKLDKKVEG